MVVLVVIVVTAWVIRTFVGIVAVAETVAAADF